MGSERRRDGLLVGGALRAIRPLATAREWKKRQAEIDATYMNLSVGFLRIWTERRVCYDYTVSALGMVIFGDIATARSRMQKKTLGMK